MLAQIIAALLGATGKSFLDSILGHLERKAEGEVERARVDAAREANANAEAAGIVKAGMQHKAFWIAWLMAALPLSAWFGWGVVDSMLWNGTVLPDIAALPPQLKEYADIVWGNIFYTGAGVAGAQAVASALRGKR